VLEAARRLSGDYRIYITGKLKKNRLNGLAVPDNVILTDFLSEPDYIKLLSSSDAIVVLTNTDNCMVCGAYEAVALGKPLILSNKKVLRDYFFQGVIFTENNPQHLAEAIMRAIAEKTSLEADIKDLKAVLEQSWAEQSEALYEKLHGKEAFKSVPS
jgi:glycosyltransferase involved in cell wall biosynthesis